MKNYLPVILMSCAALFVSCSGSGEEAGGPTCTDYPNTVTVKAEEAVNLCTGEVVKGTDFLRNDLVFYSNQTIKISSGCPEKSTECQPLHICRPSPASKPETFTSLTGVCMELPGLDEDLPITNAETGMGFVVQLNTMPGHARVWVKQVGVASCTLVYEVF
jgi:hypothetical protein